MAQMTDEAVRQRVQALLDNSGMSMRGASLAAGLGETFLRDYLTGRVRQLSSEAAIALAKVWNKTPDYVLFGLVEDDTLVRLKGRWPSMTSEQRALILRMAQELSGEEKSTG